MSKNETRIRFQNLYTLWSYAQSIQVSTMEIRTEEKLLICRCTEEDIALALKKYGGEVFFGELKKV